MGVKPSEISFFSTGYFKAVESALEFIREFGDEYSTLHTNHLLYDAQNCKQFFDENLTKLRAGEVVFSIGHLPFVEHVPLWFFNKIHPREGNFQGKYGQDNTTGIYIDLKTGENRELSFK